MLSAANGTEQRGRAMRRALAALVASLAGAAQASAQCALWSGAGTANNTLAVLAEFDEDGPGPMPPAMFAAGQTITTVGGVSANGIARFIGGAWTAVGTMTPGGGFMAAAPKAMVVFDDDGPGPHAPALYLAGTALTLIDGVAVNGVAKWDGLAWSPVGAVVAGATAVFALGVFDEDGPGPGLPALIAAGSFSSIGGTSAQRVARWNGAAWSAMGAGLPVTAFSLAVLDEDGAGPALPTLYAGLAGAPALFEWNGSAWAAAASQPAMPRISTLISHDDDGPGPARAVLYCANSAHANNTASVASRPAGGAWTTLATYPASGSDVLYSLSIDDADDEGPGRSRVIAGFSFGSPLPGLQQHDGAFWSPVPGLPPPQATTDVAASHSWHDPSGAGGAAPAIFVAFQGLVPSGPLTGQLLAALRFAPSVLTLSTPASVSVPAGGSAIFEVHAAAGSPVNGFRWRNNGAPLADGGAISGAATDTLTINPVSASDAGIYECEAATDCASALSRPAFLSVPAADTCPADTNGDHTIDFLDLNAILSFYGMACP